jgi:hypothetical protein
VTRVRFVLLLIVTGAAAGVWFSLPPETRHLTILADPTTLRGAVHVHTQRSDGTGTPDDVAIAARRAGLDFVVLTDHGDATRMPDPPRYVDGVLVIDAVEISTTGGHYIALGLARAPYRLAGEPRDVVEDVRRLGGFGIVAHPDSPKPELSWRAWRTAFDGLEWLNADSQWRDEPRRSLARALLGYWFRRPEAIVSMFDRPTSLLERWDALSQRRRVVGIAGHDAHARMSLGGGWEPTGDERSLALPSYEAAFKSFAVRTVLEHPIGRTASSAAADAGAVVDAIRAGRAYTVIDAVAGPARLAFSASARGGTTLMGGEVADAGPVTLTATLTPPVTGATIAILKNGVVTTQSPDSRVAIVHAEREGAATYRVEVGIDGAPGSPRVPWIVGNPIYITRGAAWPGPPTVPRVIRERPIDEPSAAAGWRIEQQAQSEGAVDAAAPPALDPKFHKPLRFAWHLAPGARASQYVALVTSIDGRALRSYTQLAFRARASRPMRLSVQLRVPRGGGRRWQRSVYIDTVPTDIVVPMSEMTAIEAASGRRMHLERADSLLFVVDTVNTAPGTAGETWLDSIRWQITLPQRR